MIVKESQIQNSARHPVQNFVASLWNGTARHYTQYIDSMSECTRSSQLLTVELRSADG